jgi:hypothetical protein
VDDFDILLNTVRGEPRAFNHFLNQATEDVTMFPDETYDNASSETSSQPNSNDEDNEVRLELVDDEQNVAETSGTLRRSICFYGLSDLVHQQDSSTDSVSTLHENPLERPLVSANKRAAPPVATRDSIAQSLYILATSAEYEFISYTKMHDIAQKLRDIAAALASVSVDGVFVGKNLCALAFLCSVHNRIIAFDLYLIAADYYYFVLKDYANAGNALERAAGCINKDVRRVVSVLERASEIYELCAVFDAAIRVEKQLETFDLSVDWIAKCRARQSALRCKLVV